MFSDSRWWYTYVVSVSQMVHAAMRASELHMLSLCSAPTSQIGQPAMISSLMKRSLHVFKALGDFCWWILCISLFFRVILLNSEIRNSPDFRGTSSHSYLCVPWYVAAKMLITGCIWARVERVWRCRGTDQVALWAFKLSVVGGDVPTLSSAVWATNRTHSITKLDPSKGACCSADVAAAGVGLFIRRQNSLRCRCQWEQSRAAIIYQKGFLVMDGWL